MGDGALRAAAGEAAEPLETARLGKRPRTTPLKLLDSATVSRPAPRRAAGGVGGRGTGAAGGAADGGAAKGGGRGACSEGKVPRLRIGKAIRAMLHGWFEAGLGALKGATPSDKQLEEWAGARARPRVRTPE